MGSDNELRIGSFVTERNESCGEFNVITRTDVQFRRIPEKNGIVPN
jgi:hypothetical protein